MDVLDSNQSTGCQQQNIYSAVEYLTQGHRISDPFSVGYPTLPCRIFDVCEPNNVGYPTPECWISNGLYRFFYKKN